MKLFFRSRDKKNPDPAPIFPNLADQPAADTVIEPPADPVSAAAAAEADIEQPPVEISASDDVGKLLGDLLDIGDILGGEIDLSNTEPPAAPAESGADDATAGTDDVLYRRLLNGFYDGVLLVDAKGSVFCSNGRAEKFFGYSDAEFWSMPVEKLVRGVNAKMLFKIRTHTESGRFTVISAVGKRKDGTTFPAEIAINHIDLFNKDDMIFSIRNMERREKSREQQELRDDAIRGAGSAIVVCNGEGLVEFANPMFIRLVGCSTEQEILKRFMGDFFSSNDSVSALLRTPSGSGTWMGNLEMITEGGKVREVLAVANLAPERPNIPSRLVVTLTPLPRAAVRAVAAVRPAKRISPPAATPSESA